MPANNRRPLCWRPGGASFVCFESCVGNRDGEPLSRRSARSDLRPLPGSSPSCRRSGRHAQDSPDRASEIPECSGWPVAVLRTYSLFYHFLSSALISLQYTRSITGAMENSHRLYFALGRHFFAFVGMPVCEELPIRPYWLSKLALDG